MGVKNRPEIDGLRALAVLPVLLFHAELGFPGGFVGVDVFFVISGFLITGLILDELDKGNFRILQFWERRVRRVLPALSAVVLAALIAGWFLFLAQDFQHLARSAIAQALLLSNVFFWRDSGYFTAASEIKPLLHTWSLALEEQFYLLFPLLLLALKRCSRKTLIITLLLLLAASLSLSVYGSYHLASATFYLLPTRAWELLLGAVLAGLPSRSPGSPWLHETLGWTGLLAILYSLFFFGRETPFPGFAALLPCLGAALLILSNSARLTSTGKLLSLRPFVLVGLMSYSLYLWHWPLLVFSRYWRLDPLPILHRSLLLAASLLLARLSWSFIESPVRQRRILQKRAHLFAFAAIVTCFLCCSAFVIDRTQGIPSRLPPAIRQYADGSTNKAFLRELALQDVLKNDFVELGTVDQHQPVTLLVWGDSHAMSVMPVLNALSRDHSVRALGAAHSSTPPLLGYESRDRESLQGDCVAFNQAIVDFVRREHVTRVLLVANWGFYIDVDHGTSRLRRGLLATVDALKNSGATVWVLRQVPKHRWNVPKALASTVFNGGDPTQMGLPFTEHLKDFHRQDAIFAGLESEGVSVLDPTQFFVRPPDLCRVTAGGKILYYDSHHLSIDGAMTLRPLFEQLWASPGQKRTASSSPPE